ncbi:MAG: protein translocase subunit SecD [Deltaproteobacteria bacterium]
MFKSIKARVIITLIVSLVSLFCLIPTLFPNMTDVWKNMLPTEKIHLGLDLQGGTHLVLGVDTPKAVENWLQRTGNDIKSFLMEKGVRFQYLDSQTQHGVIKFELPDAPSKVAFELALKERFPDIVIVSSSSQSGREVLSLKFTPQRETELKKIAVEQSLETIRNRIDQFGVTEPEIIPEGDDRMVLQLPGIKDPARAKNIIGKTALLEFKLVDDEHQLDDALKGAIPQGSHVAYARKIDRTSGRSVDTPFLLKERALMTGESLEGASVKIGGKFGDPYIELKFNDRGASEFERITGDNVKKRLAIVLDGVVHSAPEIRERISGGQAIIEGSFSMDDAKDLAIVLRAGALPAPVQILEERSVGPSLGQDSIEQGVWACLIGGLLVIIFMGIYYRWSGMIANVALIFNMLILLGALAVFKATLTLPGLAGIVLTIGMAVDANVIIFERIREELRNGKLPKVAVDVGYSRAFLTILDANVTTLIAALFLFGFGTGPVKGFAVTLTIGILASMFTAIFVTRIIFDYMVQNKNSTSLSIG